MKNTDNLPILLFETQRDWEAWLKEHHSEAAGIWLKLAKKGAGIASLTYAEALESALCYGWIDGQMPLLIISAGCKNSPHAVPKASGHK